MLGITVFHAAHTRWTDTLQVDRATHSVDLSQQHIDSGRPGAGKPPPPGSLVTGRVTAAGGFGLRLRLAGGSTGTVGLCDVHDTYVGNALAGAPCRQSRIGCFELCQALLQHGQWRKPHAGTFCVAHGANVSVLSSLVLLAASSRSSTDAGWMFDGSKCILLFHIHRYQRRDHGARLCA
jgi:hypothetical protein